MMNLLRFLEPVSGGVFILTSDSHPGVIAVCINGVRKVHPAVGFSAEMVAQKASRRDTPDERQRWMSLFAKAEGHELEAAWNAIPDRPDYSFLRPPEPGLVMIRGRAGGTGQLFNVGEITVTRCAVRLADGAVGLGYVAGRDQRRAELAAVFDAMMQRSDGRRTLEATLVTPVAERLASARRETAAKTAATKVDFFTLVRGEGEC